MSQSGHHIVSIKTYFKVLIALFFLTIITVAVATPVTGVDFGILNTLIAMAIATAKAVLVGMFFMHLKYDTKMYLAIFLTAIATLFLLAFFIYFDYFSREVVTKTLL